MKPIFTKQTSTVAATLGVVSFALAGCGGSEVDGLVPLPTPTPAATPAASVYAGTYRSTLALPEGRTGATAIVVAANGAATGTLTVSDAATRSFAVTLRTRQATPFSFGAGTFSFSGTVDPATGAFSMSGNLGGEPFTYIGTLPAPGNGNVGGSYSLTVRGQNYSGSFANPGVQPTPAPSPSPTPGVGSGGAQSLTFSDITGTHPNIDLSPLTNATFSSDGAEAGAGIDNTNETLTISTGNKVVGSTPTEAIRLLSITLVRENGTVKTGDVFDYVTTNGNIRTAFTQVRLSGTTPGVVRDYRGTAGTVTVVSRTATSITVRVNGLRMSHFDTATNTANRFTVDGELTAPIK